MVSKLEDMSHDDGEHDDAYSDSSNERHAKKTKVKAGSKEELLAIIQEKEATIAKL